MVDAIVGAVIMVVSTTSLLLAIEVAEDAFRAAGRYPLNEDELMLLDSLSESLSDNPAVLKEIEGVEDQVSKQLISKCHHG